MIPSPSRGEGGGEGGVVLDDVLELTTPGGTRRITLTPTFIDELVEMMTNLTRRDPASTNLALTGHKSTGKNTAVYVLAALLKQPVRTMSLRAHTTEADLRWRITVGLNKAGTTERMLSEYFEAAKLGDWIVVDEATKVIKQGALTSLNTMNQHRRETLPDGTKVVADRTFKAFFLWNPPGGIYKGQDPEKISSFLSRLSGVHFSYMEPDEEIKMLMETVFGKETEEDRNYFLPIVEGLVKVANEIRAYADSAIGQADKVPPLDPRQLQRMLIHLREFPDDIDYLQEIFELDYPLSAITETARQAFKNKLYNNTNGWFKRSGLDAPEYSKRFHDNNDNVLIDPGWPRVDVSFQYPSPLVGEGKGEGVKVVVFGTPETGEFSLPLGNLDPDEAEVKDFLDIHENRLLLWLLAKDLKLGIDIALLGEKGSGKTEIILYLLKGLLRWDLETPPQITESTRGHDILGTHETRNARSHFPKPPLQRAMEDGRPIFYDEITMAGPDVLATLHNAAEYRFVTVTSRKLAAAKPGFSMILAGNIVAGHHQANAFSAEFGSRFRIHETKSLNKENLTMLLKKDSERLKKQALEEGMEWDDLDDDAIDAMAQAFLNLLGAFRGFRLRVPPDYRQLHRLLETISERPTSRMSIETGLLNEMVIQKPEYKAVVLEESWPLARIRLKQAARHFARTRGLNDDMAMAVGETLALLIHPSFPILPENNHVNSIYEALLKNAAELLTPVKVADAISNALGITARDHKAKVEEAVKMSNLHLVVSQQALELARANLETAIEDNVTSLKVDERLRLPLKALAGHIVEMVRTGLAPAPPDSQQMETMVKSFLTGEMLKKDWDAADSISSALKLTQPAQKESTQQAIIVTGLADTTSQIIEEERAKQPASLFAPEVVEAINEFLTSLLGLTAPISAPPQPAEPDWEHAVAREVHTTKGVLKNGESIPWDPVLGMPDKTWAIQASPTFSGDDLRMRVLTKVGIDPNGNDVFQVVELVAPPLIAPTVPPSAGTSTTGHAWSLGEAMRFNMKALAEKGPGFYKLFWDGHKIIWAAGYRYSDGQVWTSWHGKPGNLRGIFDLARWAVWIHERFSHDVGLVMMIPFILALGVIKTVKNILHPITVILRLPLTPAPLLKHESASPPVPQGEGVRRTGEDRVASRPFTLTAQQMLDMEHALNEIMEHQPEDAAALLGTLMDSAKPGPLMLDALGNPLLGLVNESQDDLLPDSSRILNGASRHLLGIVIEAWMEKFKEEPSQEVVEQITTLYGKAKAHGANGNVLRAHLILFYAFQKAILGEQGVSWLEMLRSFETGESVRRQRMMNEAPEIDNKEVLLVNMADIEYAPEYVIKIVEKRMRLLLEGTPGVADLVLTDGLGRDYDPEAFNKIFKTKSQQLSGTGFPLTTRGNDEERRLHGTDNLEARIRFHKVSSNGVDINELHEKLGYKARGIPLAALIVDIKRGHWNVVSAITNELIRLIQAGEHDLFNLKTYIGKELKNARVILEQA